MAMNFSKVSVPWYGWNSFVHLENPKPVGPPVGPYRVFVRLAPASDNRAVIPEPLNDASKYLLGDSRFKNTVTGYDFRMEIEGRAGMIEYKLHSNSEGRLAAIELGPISANGLSQALAFGMRAYYTVAVMISAQCQVPMNYAAVLTSAANGDWLATVRTESPVVDFDPLSFDTNPALRLFMPTYLDGLRANSSFYSLLCFFKIGDFLGREYGYKIREACLRYNLTSRSEQKHVIPADPFRTLAPEYVGRKILDVLEDIEHKYRNNIGHLDAADIYMPATFEGEEKMRAMAVVARYVASQLVSDAIQDIRDLLQAGMQLRQLGEMFGLTVA